MKIKVEIEATPDEVQDLFIPSSKQKEFAQALYTAYIDAMSKTVSGVMNKTIVENPFFKGRKRKPSRDDS